MINFLEVLKKEIEEKHTIKEVNIGFQEDDIAGVLPAILITPGGMSKANKTLAGMDKKIEFNIYYFDIHNQKSSIEEIKEVEKLLNFIENNVVITSKIINLNSHLTIEIEKEEEEMNGIFIGKIKIITQLRR